jgi:tetratricopeptide (TPR) repeat protein
MTNFYYQIFETVSCLSRGNLLWRCGGRSMIGSNSNGNVEYLFRMAEEAANQGNNKQALEYLVQVLNTNPKHAMAWHEKGNCLDMLENYGEALLSYDTALKLDPQNAETWFNKGLTLKKMGRNVDADVCMERAVQLALGE